MHLALIHSNQPANEYVGGAAAWTPPSPTTTYGLPSLPSAPPSNPKETRR